MAISRLQTNSAQAGFAKYQSIWDGKTAVGAMEPISTIKLNSTSGTVEFGNIPQTYKSLHIRAFVQGSRTSGYDSQCWMQVGYNLLDTGSNYDDHGAFGQSKNSSAAYDWEGNGGHTSVMPPNNAGTQAAGNFSIQLWDLIDYNSTTKYKTFKCVYGEDPAGLSNGYGGTVGFSSGHWRNLNPINVIRFTMSGYNFNPESYFSLYGVK